MRISAGLVWVCRMSLVHCGRAAHGQEDNTDTWSSEQSEGEEGRWEEARVVIMGEGVRVWISIDPLGSRCPLGPAADQCSPSVLFNLSLSLHLHTLPLHTHAHTHTHPNNNKDRTNEWKRCRKCQPIWVFYHRNNSKLLVY